MDPWCGTSVASNDSRVRRWAEPETTFDRYLRQNFEETLPYHPPPVANNNFVVPTAAPVDPEEMPQPLVPADAFATTVADEPGFFSDGEGLLSVDRMVLQGAKVHPSRVTSERCQAEAKYVTSSQGDC